MPAEIHLGEFEQLVLLAVVRLAPDAYGMTVRRESAARTGREPAIGAIYAPLDRLEGKGLVRSAEGPPTAQRGGRAKRLFELTAAGEAALREARRALLSMSEGLALFGDGPLPGEPAK